METENVDSKSKMEDYEVIQQIGKGAFGASFLVLHKTENKKYVLKKIRLPKQTEKLMRKVHQEMSLIVKLHHPYILEYKDAWVDKGSCICIVTNYCEGGNIYESIRKTRGAYFAEEKLCRWLTQLLLAIDYLHSNRVVHRDIKLSNIFLTKEDDMRLGDFGLAKLIDEESLPSSVFGTPSYMSPELIASAPYGYKSDIWSLGCCMFEIAAHHQAFRAPDMAGLIKKINASLISPFPIAYSSTLKQIIKSMLRKSPEHRPTAAELLRHPHLQPSLLRCHSLSAVYLPVKSPKSPSAKNTKEKMKKQSPGCSRAGKDYEERDMKLKQRELLPLFPENTHLPHPNLLDGYDMLEDKLETKRVDPTSYSGKISNDSEDSKSRGTTASSGDDPDTFYNSSVKESVDLMDALKLLSDTLLKEQEEYFLKNSKKLEDAKKDTNVEPLCSPVAVTHENCSKMTLPDAVCRDEGRSYSGKSALSAEETIISELEVEPRCSSVGEGNTGPCLGVPLDNMSTDAEIHLDKDGVEMKADSSSDQLKAEKEGTGRVNPASIVDLLSYTPAVVTGGSESKGEIENPGLQRADALESLLELCARLLKKGNFDELSGVLKAFGEDAVSSRETAIWLTKSLKNMQNLARES